MSNKFTAGPWRAEGMDIMGEWEDGEKYSNSKLRGYPLLRR